MAKQKKNNTNSLIPRIERLEKLISQQYGLGIEQLEEESEADNPVVEETRYQKSVLRKHKDGKIEFLKTCPFCHQDVNDLPTHLVKCPKRPIY